MSLSEHRPYPKKEDWTGMITDEDCVTTVTWKFIDSRTVSCSVETTFWMPLGGRVSPIFNFQDCHRYSGDLD